MFSPYLSPSVDWLTITSPAGDFSTLCDDVRNVISDVPGITAAHYGWDFSGGGTMHVKSYPLIGCVSTSGAAICAMRSVGVWGLFLRALSSWPHRVTRLDVALDVPVSDSSAALSQVYADGCNGRVVVGSRPLAMKRILSPAPWDSSLETGTVYFGYRAKSSVSARVYDKRLERLDRGCGDIGANWLRYELSLDRRVGVSLHDASSPDRVYWHYMGGLLPAPGRRGKWAPSADSYELSPRVQCDGLVAFKRRLEGSTELSSLIAQSKSTSGGSMALLLYLHRCGLTVPQGADLSRLFQAGHPVAVNNIT